MRGEILSSVIGLLTGELFSYLKRKTSDSRVVHLIKKTISIDDLHHDTKSLLESSIRSAFTEVNLSEDVVHTFTHEPENRQQIIEWIISEVTSYDGTFDEFVFSGLKDYEIDETKRFLTILIAHINEGKNKTFSPENLMILFVLSRLEDAVGSLDNKIESLSLGMQENINALKKNQEYKTPNIRLRRVKENIPKILIPLTSGRDILTVTDGTYMCSLHHDEFITIDEVELGGRFLQEIRDWGDTDDEPYERVRVEFSLSQFLKDLDTAGFIVVGNREVQVMEQDGQVVSNCPIAIINVIRKSNPDWIQLDT